MDFRVALRLFVYLLALCASGGSALAGQTDIAVEAQAESRLVEVSRGWHPWFEVRADPEDPNKLMICGSRWIAKNNALYGFVYSSADGGISWRIALEDRNSSWVSEQSCAFGPNHTAYFVSEASKVIDGQTHHNLGRTRIFISHDGGQQWSEAAQTGWADWSTSAVSVRSGSLMSFFNFGDTAEQNIGWGSTVGLLVFPKDGSHLSGPYLDGSMRTKGYTGVYPSDATALADGSVVSLYWGVAKGAAGYQAELALERVEPKSPGEPAVSIVAKADTSSTRSCLALTNYALTYDAGKNRIFVVYYENRDDTCQLVLATSDDRGQSWVKEGPITDASGSPLATAHPSVAVNVDGELGLLWESGTKEFFAVVQDGRLREAPVLVYEGSAVLGVLNDSLWTVLTSPDARSAVGNETGAVVKVNVRDEVDTWRSGRLAAIGHRFCAVLPVVEPQGQTLFSRVLSSLKSETSSDSSPADVTSQVALAYGRGQHFDNLTGTLSLELSLINRGSTPIHNPICLEVKRVGSDVGKIRILNASNALPGLGAVWNISRYITGDQIPPGSSMYNAFPLLFHIDLSRNRPAGSEHLLDLSVKVLSVPEAHPHSQTCAEPQKGGDRKLSR
jgi:hypothetical protein